MNSISKFNIISATPLAITIDAIQAFLAPFVMFLFKLFFIQTEIKSDKMSTSFDSYDISSSLCTSTCNQIRCLGI